MAILGLLYLAIYSIQVVYSRDINLSNAMEVASIAIWLLFTCDVLIRLIGSRNIPKFLKSSWLEILALAIPFMRILRIFRVVVAIRGLKPYLKTRIAATGVYLLLLLPLTWFAGAVAVLDAESSNPNSSITNLPDALWWALATITTVGYGEFYPTTLEGKFVAAILMVTGIALFSAGAGMFASWIMGEKKTT
jgi:voltage-gated potassium channel